MRPKSVEALCYSLGIHDQSYFLFDEMPDFVDQLNDAEKIRLSQLADCDVWDVDNAIANLVPGL